MNAVVMGGGMSGLAAAINLLDLGIEVSVFESDSILGGRASSWHDEDGDLIDNALHVFFPYYVNLLNFFEKLGIENNIIWKNTEFYYAQAGGNLAILKFKKLPAPLHAIYAFSHLLKDYRDIPRWKVIAAALPLGLGFLLSEEKVKRLDNISMATLVYKFAPLEGLKVMEPGINGLTFTPSYAVSAKVMLNWGMKVMGSASTARVGFANGGMGEIWVDRCREYIESRGGKIFLETPVESIEVESGKVKAIRLGNGNRVEADLYISTLPPFLLRRILPKESFNLEYFRDLFYFEHAPSLSLQIWFDRKVTDVDVTFFSTDCVFNTYADLSNVLPHIFKEGSMFEMVLSPADHLIGLPDKLIFDLAIGQIENIFPLIKRDMVRKWKLVRERQGVYRPFPGMESHRPFQRSPYENLYLAGDYTRTEVSSGGMEAAIWSANKVAELVAEDYMGKAINLNVEFMQAEPFMKVARPVTFAVMIALALKAGRFFWRFLTRTGGKKT